MSGVRWPKNILLAVFLALAVLSTQALAQNLPFLEHSRVDPTKIMNAESCGECHIAEFEVWEKTPHATGFKTLHRKPQAETIARKMGFRLIKRDSLCFSCHYTPVVDGNRIRVVSGVSCESCHGAGAGWIDIHNDYGPGRNYRSEPVADRDSRIESSRRAGMRRPSDLYPVVANCFSCHTVPSEKLVNVGGHTTGSSGFEFVEWSQEKIRHNYLESQRTGKPGPNATRPIERKRMMYVVGRALDLEYSLRGMAVAKGEGVYAKAMSRRVRSALSEIRAIDGSASISEIGEMIAAVAGVRVVPDNEAALVGAAEKVGAATRAFLRRKATLDIAALDPLVLGIANLDDTVEGVETSVAERASGETGAKPASPASDRRSPEPPAGTGQDGSAKRGSGTTASSSTTSTGVVGEFKRWIRPASKHKTLGPGACSGCHTEQNEWWFGHDHYGSADPFFDAAPENLRIARLYGIRESEITKGRQVCMDCHGTVVSGKESRDVLDGVSCESCHGAAADWLETHKDETDKHLGRRRPGHLRALQRGKLDLGDLTTRAETCSHCHYITEPRLLSAGHPSGADFDYVGGMAKVRHWQHAPAAEAEIASSYSAVRATRGPVPKVHRAVLERTGTGATQHGTSAESTKTGPSGSRVAPARTTRSFGQAVEVQALRPPPPRPAAKTGGRQSSPLNLPPFPEVTESISIEELLLLVRDRLKLLYGIVDSDGQGQSR